MGKKKCNSRGRNDHGHRHQPIKVECHCVCSGTGNGGDVDPPVQQPVWFDVSTVSTTQLTTAATWIQFNHISRNVGNSVNNAYRVIIPANRGGTYNINGGVSYSCTTPGAAPVITLVVLRNGMTQTLATFTNNAQSFNAVLPRTSFQLQAGDELRLMGTGNCTLTSGTFLEGQHNGVVGNGDNHNHYH